MDQVFLEPVFEKKTRYAKQKVATYLSNIVEDLISGKINQSYEKSFVPLSLSEIPRIISNYKSDNPEENMIIQLIRNAILGSENSHASSSLFFLILMSKMLLELQKSQDNSNKILHDLEMLLKKAGYCKSPAMMKDITGCWKSLFRDNFNNYILEKSLALAGPSGNVYLNKGSSDDTSMELVCGYPYRLSSPEEFLTMTEIKNVSFNDCKILIIDGLLEKESEIHLILQNFHEKMQPGIIFARGFKEEVIATLATNWNRGTLKVIPILVPYDLEGVNLLKDIAVISGNDVTSSLKGELISSIDIEDLSEVSKFSYDSGKIIIENERTSESVRKHISNLKTTILENPQGAKRDMLSKRIKGLLSRCVYIKIDDSLFEKKAIYIDRLETGIRMYRDISRYGLINLEKIDANNQPVVNDLVDILVSCGFEKISFIAFCEALKRTISISRVLGNCNTMVLCKN